MNKLILSLLLLTGFLSVSFGQIRHVRGIRSVDLAAGVSKFGLVGGVSYVTYLSNKFYGKLSGFYEIGEDSGIKYASSGMDIGGCFNLFKVKEGFYVNASSGLTLTLDRLTRDIENVNVSNTFKSGIYFGFENEIFIIDKLVFIAGANQRFLTNKNFGNYRFYLYGGFRYNF